MPGPFNKRVSLYEDEQGLALLKELARRRGVSATDLLRMLVREEAGRQGLTRPDRLLANPPYGTPSQVLDPFAGSGSVMDQEEALRRQLGQDTPRSAKELAEDEERRRKR